MPLIQLPKKSRIFSDINLAFIPNPESGDIQKRFDDDTIKTAVKNLVLTRNFERPFHSEIGSQVKNLLFEPFTPMLNNLLKQTIWNLITKFEPRVTLIDIPVVADPDNNAIQIAIIFTIVNTTRPITLTLTLERSR